VGRSSESAAQSFAPQSGTYGGDGCLQNQKSGVRVLPAPFRLSGSAIMGGDKALNLVLRVIALTVSSICREFSARADDPDAYGHAFVITLVSRQRARPSKVNGLSEDCVLRRERPKRGIEEQSGHASL
jgi:hypothetical protein